MAGGAGFFHLLSPVPAQIADVHRRFAQIRTTLEGLGAAAAGTPVETAVVALGPRVDAAYLEFTQALEALARTLAEQATAMAVDKFDRSRVRPETGNAPKLHDLIHAVPVQTSLPTGTIGIGDIEELNKVPYWKAQEFGLSAGFVGRSLAGYFFESGGGQGYKPDPSMSRVHPLFRPVGGGLAPVMTIANAIAPKRFLTDTSAAMAADWLRQYSAIERRAVTKLAGVSGVIQALVRDLAAV